MNNMNEQPKHKQIKYYELLQRITTAVLADEHQRKSDDGDQFALAVMAVIDQRTGQQEMALSLTRTKADGSGIDVRPVAILIDPDLNPTELYQPDFSARAPENLPSNFDAMVVSEPEAKTN